VLSPVSCSAVLNCSFQGLHAALFPTCSLVCRRRCRSGFLAWHATHLGLAYMTSRRQYLPPGPCQAGSSYAPVCPAALQVLTGAPAGLQALHTPSPRAASGLPQDLQSLGAVLCHLKPTDPITGQAVLSFWPPVVLQNSMPLPLTLRLLAGRASGREAFQGGLAEGKAVQAGSAAATDLASATAAAAAEGAYCWRTVEDGCCLPLRVQYEGGELGRLRLGAGASEPGPQQQKQQQAAGGLSVAICTPPMVGAPVEAASPTPPDAMLIPPPGDYILVDVPVAPGSSESSRAALAAGAPPFSLTNAAEKVAGAADAAAGRGAAAAAAAGSGAEALPAGRQLECVLLTEQRSDELPVLKLTVVPRGVVRNVLPVAILFQASLATLPLRAGSLYAVCCAFLGCSSASTVFFKGIYVVFSLGLGLGGRFCKITRYLD
jgi:hypothetical protein